MVCRFTASSSAIIAFLAILTGPPTVRAMGGDTLTESQRNTARRNSAKQNIDVAAAVAEALDHNPELLAAREELTVARGQIVKAGAVNAFNPTLGGVVSNRGFDGGGSKVQASAELSLEVEVAGQRGERIDAANRNLERIQAEIDDVSRLLRAEVEQAFYGAIYARERQRLASEVEQLTRRVSDASAARFRAGEAPKMEPNISRIRYSQSRRDQLTAERQYGDARRKLERLLGREPVGAIVPDGDLRPRSELVPEADRLLERAFRERPDLRAQTAEIGRVEAEEALTRRLAVPNVTFGAFYDEEAEAGGGRDHILGGGLTIPLPLFDRQQGELLGLAGRRSQAQHQRQAAALSIRAEVADAVRAYATALEGVRVYESDVIALIDENFRFIEVAYREGKIDLLELAVVQNDLVESRATYLESLYEYWLSRIALERAVGAEPFDPLAPDRSAHSTERR